MRRFYNDQEREDIKNMLTAGNSVRDISIHLNRTINSLRTEITRGGGLNNYAPKRLGVPDKVRTKEKVEESREHIKINLEIRKQIEFYIKKGLKAEPISLLLDCAQSTIRYELNRMPKGEIYSAEKAQSIADEIEKNAKNKISVIRAAKKPLNLDIRIGNLEMQMEILIEQIKKLKGS